MNKKILGATEKVINYIVVNIENGYFVEGDRIESERVLSNKLKVSRSSVREAILHLSVLGYLKSIEKKGTFVTSKYNDDTAMNYNIREVIKLAYSFDLIETRMILEINCIDLAVKRYNHNDIIELRKAIANMERNKNSDVFQADLEFHYALAKTTHNSTIIKLMKIIVDEVINHKEFFRPTGPVYIEHSIESFKKIVDYIINNRPTEAKILFMQHFSLIEGLLKDKSQD